MIAILKNADERPTFDVARNRDARYRSLAAVNPADGRRNPRISRRNSAPITIAGAIFLPAVFMAAVFGQASAWPGAYYPGIPTPLTAVAQSRRKDRGGSEVKVGAVPMQFSLSTITPALRALAHRRMALSALRANSSLSVRLTRYRHHMDRARALENAGGVQ